MADCNLFHLIKAQLYKKASAGRAKAHRFASALQLLGVDLYEGNVLVIDLACHPHAAVREQGLQVKYPHKGAQAIKVVQASRKRVGTSWLHMPVFIQNISVHAAAVGLLAWFALFVLPVMSYWHR